MPVESISQYFLSIRGRKILQYEGNGYLQKICHSCKKTDKKTKKQTEVASGI